MFKNTDMKNYKARGEPEGVILMRMFTYFMIAALLAVLAWMDERDHQYQIEQLRETAQCESASKQVKP